jgi:hypothetical protein
MKVIIQDIAGHGDYQEERVQLEVKLKTNMHYYMLADTTFTDASLISNKVRHTHWFSKLEVNAGDAVVLYTRPGEYSTKRRADGSLVHFVYWGLQKAVWNDAGDAGVLFELESWTTKRAK